MNEMSIKPTAIDDASHSHGNRGNKTGKAAALAALVSSFQELVHKVGTTVDTGLSSISERQGISAVSEPRDPSSQYDYNRGSQRDDDGNHQVARDKDDTRANSRNDAPRNDHGENSRRGSEVVAHDDRRDIRDRGDTRHADDGSAEGKDFSEPTAQAERPLSDDRRDENQASSGDDSPAGLNSSQSGDNGQNNAANSDGRSAKDGSQNTDVALAAAQGAAPVQGLDAAQLLAQTGSQALNENGQASEVSKVNATSGMANATAASAKAAGIHAAATGREQTVGTNGQIQANTGGQNQSQMETATNNQRNIQQQAQQMARTMGDNARMQINVSVTDEAETLTSRPTTTLAAGVTLAADSRSQTQSGQQHNSHTAAPGQAQAAAANAGQTQGGQAQGNNAQANAQGGQAQGNNAQASVQSGQAQAAVQVGGEAKGLGTTSGTAHAGNASASTGGGEGTSSGSNINANSQAQQTQQAQQTAQAQRNGQARGPQSGPTPAEQVSVRISRALQAGNDRISIRLNPADMGRVEVKMELASDGRMSAVVTADNRETLELLKRDASALQKALEEGGLDLDSGNLAFNLRGEDGQTADGGDGSVGTPDLEEELAEQTVDVQPELILNPEDVVLGEGRVDVKA